MRKAIAASLTLALALAPSALAQLPRTPDGRPDLQGVWSSHFMTGLERPDGITGLVVAPADADKVLKKIMPKIPEVYDPEFNAHPFPEALLDVKGELRSSMLIKPDDGKLPSRRSRAPASNTSSAASTIPRTVPAPNAARTVSTTRPCRSPMTSSPTCSCRPPGHRHRHRGCRRRPHHHAGRACCAGAASHPRRQLARPLGGRHADRRDRSFRDRRPARLRLARRRSGHRRQPCHRTLQPAVRERDALYQFTIEDPSLYNAPWLAEYVMRRSTHQLYEYACHEGNYGMANILSAARPPRPAGGKAEALGQGV